MIDESWLISYCHRRSPPCHMHAVQRTAARSRGRTERFSYLQWLFLMPRHGNAPKKLQSSPSDSLSARLYEALSHASVTNRSLHPQKLVTMALRNGCSRHEANRTSLCISIPFRWRSLCLVFSQPASRPRPSHDMKFPLPSPPPSEQPWRARNDRPGDRSQRSE
jgi:hypothetical protein